eukprot:4080296-Amphidinium_carterae.1
MRPGVWGPLCGEVAGRGQAVGGLRTSGSKSSAQLPLYRTCQRQRGARAMISSAADRCEIPFRVSSTIECSQHRAAATRVRLRRGSSDWHRIGICNHAVDVTSSSELHRASHGGVAAT